MTYRIASYASLITALLVSAMPAFAANELTGKTLIDGDVVTVGDLFTNTGTHAKYVLAPAPEAGKKLTLSTDDLMRVAKAFKLDWQPAEYDYVSLERNASLIDTDMMINALNSSDLHDKIDNKAEIKLSSHLSGILVEGKETPEMVISNTSYDPQTEKFSASLQIKRDGDVLKEVRLEGIAAIMAKVPMLKFAMPSNTTITRNDIVEVAMPINQMRGDTIRSTEDLIGMVAKRSMQANQTVSKSDIVPPVMVKRNELVTIIYKSGAIQLSSKARSMGVGSRGDSVMFMNMSSKKSFEAKVTGPQVAEVNLDG